MNALERLGNCGVVPVVVLDRAEDAVPTAHALLAGGVDVMEITLRTAAGLEAIREVAQKCPQMCVGAGTVLTLDQCKQSVEAGAQFIVSPGLNAELVKWCIANGVAVTPGCVTPTEITAGLELGLNVFKFFPADVYGGLNAMKALSAPFGSIQFIPTGGVSQKNLAEYVAAPFIHAVGGTWFCAKQDINEGNFDNITALSADARKTSLGFEVAHIGINTENEDAAKMVSEQFDKAFSTGIKDGVSSIFASAGIEVLKNMYLGANGHIAIGTPNIHRALAYLEKNGFAIDKETAKYKGDKLIAVYLKESFGDFAIHLLQK